MGFYDDLKYWNSINLTREIGPIRFKKLINFFPSMEAAYTASEQELKEAGLDEKIVEHFSAKRLEINPDQEYEKLQQAGIKIITFRDENYPKLLKEIYAPPAVLYVRGDILREEYCIAIIGTRKYSLYGRQVALDITEALCKIGITVVSGLAKGIDTFAHQSCVRCNNRTIAVLGSGIDHESIYPCTNRELAKEVEKGGAVISEYPLGTLPLRQNFPARNRIISGLCQGVIVIEAPEESGALITAKYALEQNREVFAIPGPINSVNSQGTNKLIKQGAKLVTGINDIIEELNLGDYSSGKSVFEQNNVPTHPDSKEEAIILNLLTSEPVHIDNLIRDSHLPTAEVNSTLTILELKGKIRDLGGMNYVLSKR